MFTIEAGVIVTQTEQGIDKIHTKDIPTETILDWQNTMEEFNRVQKEMKIVYDRAIQTGGRTRHGYRNV